MDRDEAIKRIRKGLQSRSGKQWSVTGGRGTAWGWLSISAPPRRLVLGSMSGEDSIELGKLLGLPAQRSSHSIASSNDHYTEYVDRAEGREPTVIAKPYWD